MSAKFPDKLFVQSVEAEAQRPGGAWAAHATLEDSIVQIASPNRNGRNMVAEYTLTRIVEAKMVPDILCEVVQ